jgi:hypothetical protein
MKRLFALATLLALLALAAHGVAADKKTEASPNRAALQALNDFIGQWNGGGGHYAPTGGQPTKNPWEETVNWGWRFKGDDAWMTLEFKGGKYFKAGELHYLTDDKKYQLTLTDKDDKKQVFTGELKDDKLIVEHPDKDKKETQRITLNTAAEGIRLIYTFESKPEGRTLWKKVYQVAANKEGESLGAAAKKNVCVVSGGLGTMAVQHGGKTYYVCCSGCRDAFNENPEKYIKEFEAKQGKK